MYVGKDDFMASNVADVVFPGLLGRSVNTLVCVFSLGFAIKQNNSKHGTSAGTQNMENKRKFLVAKLSCVMKERRG